MNIPFGISVDLILFFLFFFAWEITKLLKNSIIVLPPSFLPSFLPTTCWYISICFNVQTSLPLHHQCDLSDFLFCSCQKDEETSIFCIKIYDCLHYILLIFLHKIFGFSNILKGIRDFHINVCFSKNICCPEYVFF